MNTAKTQFPYIKIGNKNNSAYCYDEKLIAEAFGEFYLGKDEISLFLSKFNISKQYFTHKFKNVKFTEISSQSINDLEGIHDYVQHFFPSSTFSQFNPNNLIIFERNIYPLLCKYYTLQDVRTMQGNIVKQLQNMLTFCANQANKGYGHNLYRITRILTFASFVLKEANFERISNFYENKIKPVLGKSQSIAIFDKAIKEAKQQYKDNLNSQQSKPYPKTSLKKDKSYDSIKTQESFTELKILLSLSTKAQTPTINSRGIRPLRSFTEGDEDITKSKSSTTSYIKKANFNHLPQLDTNNNTKKIERITNIITKQKLDQENPLQNSFIEREKLNKTFQNQYQEHHPINNPRYKDGKILLVVKQTNDEHKLRLNIFKKNNIKPKLPTIPEQQIESETKESQNRAKGKQI